MLMSLHCSIKPYFDPWSVEVENDSNEHPSMELTGDVQEVETKFAHSIFDISCRAIEPAVWGIRTVDSVVAVELWENSTNMTFRDIIVIFKQFLAIRMPRLMWAVINWGL